jgi:hypothetical protein
MLAVQTRRVLCASLNGVKGRCVLGPDIRGGSVTGATLAEQLIEVLRRSGVERVHGVVGDSLNPIVDAIRRLEGIEWIHVRNEEAGAFAAAGLRRLHLEGSLR